MRIVIVSCLLGFVILGATEKCSRQADPRDEARFKELWKQVNDANPMARLEAARQLGEVARLLRSSTASLSFLLEDRNAKVRAMAASSLSAIGPRADGALFRLVRTIPKEQDSEALRAMIGALGAIAPYTKYQIHTEKALPVIMPFVKHNNLRVRAQAIASLGAFREDARRAVPLLREAIQDTREANGVRISNIAFRTLQKIRPIDGKTTSLLFRLVKSQDLQQKGYALCTLAVIKPTDARIMPIVLHWLEQRQEPKLCYGGVTVVRSLGPHGAKAVPALIALLKQRNNPPPFTHRETDRVRNHVLGMLHDIGPAAKKAIPTLRKLAATDPNPGIRSRAQDALKDLEKLE